EVTVSRSSGLQEPVPVDRCGTLGREGGRSHRMPCEPAPTWPRPPEPTGVVRRGLAAEAPSILQDGAARADNHDGPIAESRYCVERPGDSARHGGDEAPARAVPVLDAHGAGGPDVAGGDGRDPLEVVADVPVRVGAGDGAPVRAVPVLDQRHPLKY